MTETIATALADVRKRIDGAAARAGRDPSDIELVAVSKGHTVDSIMAAYELGHRVFGENRAQEMVAKLPALPEDIQMHFVGPLQTNKVRLVRPSVVLLHSMDRLKLARAWVKGPGVPPPVLVEVNIAREPQKAGVHPDAAGELVGQALSLGLDVAGLMCIPPQVADPNQARPYFAELAQLRDLLSKEVSMPILSMGMTDDFEVAIEEGATVIRVGRAIFGPRNAVG